MNHALSKMTLLLAALAFLPGCEGFRCADGVVKDKATNLPLDSVVYMVTSADNLMLGTDSSGKFSACNRMGGCGMHGCKDIVLVFSKDGYKKVTVVNPEANTAVLLEK